MGAEPYASPSKWLDLASPGPTYAHSSAASASSTLQCQYGLDGRSDASGTTDRSAAPARWDGQDRICMEGGKIEDEQLVADSEPYTGAGIDVCETPRSSC